jgi:hypothetical protein
MAVIRILKGAQQMIYAKWIEEDGRFAFALHDNGGIAISDSEHAALLAENRNGKAIVPDANGRPVALGPSLDERREGLCNRVDMLLDAKKASGVAHGGKVYQTAPSSIANMAGVLASVSAGIPLPVGFSWRASDNTDMPMDGDQFKSFAEAVIGHINALYRASWAIKDSIRNSDSPESIDIESGWPS